MVSGPPPVQISDIYPTNLYNSWSKTGFAEMQGRRGTMEDAHCVQMHFRNDEIFLGVYDGHGGEKASAYVGNELHNIFKTKLELYEKLLQSLALPVEQRTVKQTDILQRVLNHMCAPVMDGDEIWEDLQAEDDDDEENNDDDEEDEEDVDLKKYGVDYSDDEEEENKKLDKEAKKKHAERKRIEKTSIEPIDLTAISEHEAIMMLLRESFIEVNDSMRIKGVPHGTTASVVYIRPQTKKCYIANVGDSRIVVFRKGQPVRLTVDHRPNDPDEETRIKETGGMVVNQRVNGMLAVTRAIGDSFLEPFVTADPYTTCLDLNEKTDEFIVVACDGVWDFVSDMDACKIVQQEDDPRVASVKLRDFAYNKGSTDNISAIVLRFGAPTCATGVICSEKELQAAPIVEQQQAVPAAATQETPATKETVAPVALVAEATTTPSTNDQPCMTS